MKFKYFFVSRSCRNGPKSNNMRGENEQNRAKVHLICMGVDLDLLPEPDYSRHLSSNPISVNSQSHTDVLERESHEQTSEDFRV